MDYQRIYREFIADRKAKPTPEGYTERHHILPRSMGGGDDAENLIRLTPEDHCFAHLLLAKAHGGAQWAPISVMIANWARDKLPTRREIRIAAKSRERHGLAMTGEGNPFFGRQHSTATLAKMKDAAVYELRSFDGRSIVGTRDELAAQAGIGIKSVHRLVAGNRLSAEGWFDPSHNPAGLTGPERISDAKALDEVLTLHHQDGRIWRGTRRDFGREFGASFYIQPGSKHCLGWHPEEADALNAGDRVRRRAIRASQARGDISGPNNPMAGSDRRKDMSVRMMHRSGEIFAGSLKAFADQRGIDARTYGRMRKTLLGKKMVDGKAVKSFWGWSLTDAR